MLGKWLLIAVLFVAGPVAAKSIAPSSEPVAVEAFDQGLLFRVTRPGIPDSYVFGTIHLVDPRLAEVPGEVQSALQRSKTFAAEINVAGLAVDARLASETFTDGRRLDALIERPDYDLIVTQLRTRGVALDVIPRLKPWAAMLRIGVPRSLGEGVTLDELVARAAQRQKLKSMALESPEEQVAAFDGVPMASQIALLRHVAAHRDALEAFNETAIQAWLARDSRRLLTLTDEIGSKYKSVSHDYWLLTKHIVFNRTTLMHHRLFLPLRSGRVFVAIGAAHLPGKQGLLAALAREGYRVERIW